MIYFISLSNPAFLIHLQAKLISWILAFARFPFGFGKNLHPCGVVFFPKTLHGYPRNYQACKKDRNVDLSRQISN